jgi:hypothetical protein
MLYDAMIHSHIVYCINVYGCANQTSLQKLKVKQKEAIRIISNVGYREHTNPLFKQLKILPIDKLIKFSNLKFMHNFAHGRLPLSFAEMWITNRAYYMIFHLQKVIVLNYWRGLAYPYDGRGFVGPKKKTICQPLSIQPSLVGTVT